MTLLSNQSRIATDFGFGLTGLQLGGLKVPGSDGFYGNGHIEIPIATLQRGCGPTLLLLSGNHGDEYEGPVALIKLVQRMASVDIQGRLTHGLIRYRKKCSQRCWSHWTV